MVCDFSAILVHGDNIIFEGDFKTYDDIVNEVMKAIKDDTSNVYHLIHRHKNRAFRTTVRHFDNNSYPWFWSLPIELDV